MAKINYKRLRKFDLGGKLTEDQQNEYEYLLKQGYSSKEAFSQIQRDAVLDEKDFDKNAAFQAAVNSMGTDAAKVMSDETLENYAEIQKLSGKTLVDSTGQNLQQTQQSTNQTLNASPVAANMRHVIDNMNAAKAAMSAAGGSGTADGSVGSLVNNLTKGNWMAAGADALVGGMKAVDQLTMGDKNFDAQSQAIDSAVHGISGALMKSGNPWAMCCCAGTIVYTNSGESKKIENLTKEDGILGYLNKECIKQPIEELFPPTYKECIQIETEHGNILRCSVDHPIYSAPEGRAKYFTVGKKKQRRIKEFSFKRAEQLNVGDFVAEIGHIPIFGNRRVKLAYLIGLLIGDGTYCKRKSPRLFTGDPCTWKYIEENNLGKITERYFPGERYSKEFRVYTFYGLNPLLRDLGIYGQTKKNKRLPINIHEWDRESCVELISGLIDTDGFVCCASRQDAGIYFSQSNIELIKQLKSILLKFGIHGTINKNKSKIEYIKGRAVHSKESFVLRIKNRESVINFYNNITLNIDYKQERLQKAYLLKLNTKSRDTSLEFHNVIADKIKRITKLGYLPVYNLCAGISHTYIADNIITHNTAGVALEGMNFATKAFGQTTEGFDVDISSGGYGNMGHMDSKSNRDFGAAIGLGGLNVAKMDRQLQERNEAAQMALQAARISDDQKLEQEARMNTVNETLMKNKIALAGGIDTTTLGA